MRTFKRKPTGRPREHQLWDGSNWDDGFLDINDGRFQVYRPDCPKHVGKSGYVGRHHVVWWLNTSELPDGVDIHHINGNKQDDRFENLCAVTRREHMLIDGRISLPNMYTCLSCGRGFEKSPGLVRYRLKHKERVGDYCSETCYHHHRKELIRVLGWRGWIDNARTITASR